MVYFSYAPQVFLVLFALLNLYFLIVGISDNQKANFIKNVSEISDLCADYAADVEWDPDVYRKYIERTPKGRLRGVAQIKQYRPINKNKNINININGDTYMYEVTLGVPQILEKVEEDNLPPPLKVLADRRMYALLKDKGYTTIFFELSGNKLIHCHGDYFIMENAMLFSNLLATEIFESPQKQQQYIQNLKSYKNLRRFIGKSLPLSITNISPPTIDMWSEEDLQSFSELIEMLFNYFRKFIYIYFCY